MAMVDALRKCLKQREEKPELPRFYVWEEGKKPTGRVGLRLIPDRSVVKGCVATLKATHSDYGTSSILSIWEDGHIYVFKAVDPSLGFQLDSHGRVIVE